MAPSSEASTPPDAPEPPPETRAFSIAFGWGGLILGGLLYILWWGAQHLPERGQEVEHGMFDFTTTDLVVLAILPLGVAAIAGRLGRRWFP